MLVGVRYIELDRQQPMMKYKLTSTYSDVEHLQEFLTNTVKFQAEDVAVYKDDVDPQDPRYPSRENLLKGMRELVTDVLPGDHLVFHFSGHGSQKPDQNNDEKDGKDEAIWPADVIPGEGPYDADNVILDDEIKEILVDKIPPGAHLVIILDCCHSGSGADLQHCHRDHWEQGVHEELMNPVPATKVSVQKIGLMGIVADKASTGVSSPTFGSHIRRTSLDDMLSPLTPPTAYPSSSTSSSASSTPESSIFDWLPSGPSSASSFGSFEEPLSFPFPKYPVVVSWAACQDPDTTLSMANSGGYFVKAFVEAFRELESATHEALLHRIRVKMQDSITNFVDSIAHRSHCSQAHAPSAPTNFLEEHTHKHSTDVETKVKRKIWNKLEQEKQAHPEPMLATLHDYHGILRTPVAALFGVTVPLSPQSKCVDVEGEDRRSVEDAVEVTPAQ